MVALVSTQAKEVTPVLVHPVSQEHNAKMLLMTARGDPAKTVALAAETEPIISAFVPLVSLDHIAK